MRWPNPSKRSPSVSISHNKQISHIAIKPDTLIASPVSPSTETPQIPTKITLEQEIARVVEGSVENLIPFGADKPTVVKKDSPVVVVPAKKEEAGLAVIDWFALAFNQDLTNQTPSADFVPVTTTNTPEQPPKLDWLQMYQSRQQQQPMEEVVEDSAPSFASRYQQWQMSRNMATSGINPEELTQPQKQDQYSAAIKSKLNWNKLLAEPVDDYKQYVPTDNFVQWSSNEMPSSDMIDIAQKQLLIPSNFAKDKEQWFGQTDM